MGRGRQPPKELLSVRQIMTEFDLSRHVVYRAIRSGDLPRFDYGQKAYRIRRGNVLGWLDAYTTADPVTNSNRSPNNA